MFRKFHDSRTARDEGAIPEVAATDNTIAPPTSMQRASALLKLKYEHAINYECQPVAETARFLTSVHTYLRGRFSVK